MSILEVDPTERGLPSPRSLAALLGVFARAEFKAPVEAITGLVNLLAEEGPPEDLAPCVEKLQGAARKLTEQVDGLLDTARVEPAVATSDPETYASFLRHELRTPITSILGYSELLIEEAGDGHVINVGIVGDVIDAARRLLGQIDAMVEFLRLNRGGLEPAARQMLDHDSDFRHPIEAIRSAIQQPADPDRGVTGRVLVVDDNTSTLDLLSRRLRRDGHEVETCDNGEAALRSLSTARFDLVLLDLLMPGLSGIEVLRTIKQRPQTAMLPVIMISALDEVDSAVRCIEAGADDYLTKPINTVLLRARMSASLERKFLRDRELAITQQLRAEQQRSERLLRNVLPASIVARLRRGETVIADHFADATILFSDVVGFTDLASTLRPSDVLDLLNDIFSRFDRLAADHGLEKIKTIGDGYMVAGGLPLARVDHASAVAEMALRMPDEVEAVSRAFGRSFGVRIGVHTGPVVAGIIGQNRFMYDVWGDTVNLASRMEQYGEPGRVHVSAATRAVLGSAYEVESRESIEVKGRGLMSTFFLNGRAAPA